MGGAVAGPLEDEFIKMKSLEGSRLMGKNLVMDWFLSGLRSCKGVCWDLVSWASLRPLHRAFLWPGLQHWQRQAKVCGKPSP